MRGEATRSDGGGDVDMFDMACIGGEATLVPCVLGRGTGGGAGPCGGMKGTGADADDAGCNMRSNTSMRFSLNSGCCMVPCMIFRKSTMRKTIILPYIMYFYALDRTIS